MTDYLTLDDVRGLHADVMRRTGFLPAPMRDVGARLQFADDLVMEGVGVGFALEGFNARRALFVGITDPSTGGVL